MTLGDILDGAFKLLKANARTVLTITAVFMVPVQLLAAFAQRGALGGVGLITAFTDPSTAEAAIESASSGPLELVAQVFSLLANFLLLPFVAGAVSLVVSASYLGRQLPPGVAVRAAGRRFWPLFASWVLVHVLEVLGFFLCILPGLAVMALSVAVAPAIVVEDLGPLQGIGRSWGLMRRRFWPVLGIAVLSGFVASTLSQVVAFVPTLGGLLVGLRWGWILLALGGIVATLVATPVVAIVATLVYFDARIRTEGFDLQVIAADLARWPASR